MTIPHLPTPNTSNSHLKTGAAGGGGGRSCGERGVVGVPDDGVVSVEGGPDVLVERRADAEPVDQVGVGDEEPTVGDEVGVAVGHGLLAELPREPAAGYERPLVRPPPRPYEPALLLRAPRRAALGLAVGRVPRLGHVEVGQTEPVQGADHGQAQPERVRVGGVHVVDRRRHPHADPAGADGAGGGLDHLPEEAAAVAGVAAVLVGSVVDAVLEELVDEVTVGAVDLHAVEARPGGVGGGAAVLGDNAGDFTGDEAARCAEPAVGAVGHEHPPPLGDGLVGGRYRRRRPTWLVNCINKTNDDDDDNISEI